jgi:pimeloyl-ACP methyl ester carboxylesterase
MNDDERKCASHVDHVVVLVHGIRTHAQWMDPVSRVLKRHDFVPKRTNYGRFGLLRFLLPVCGARERPIRRVRDLVRGIQRDHPGAKISFVAHSFGTYVVAEVLRHFHDIKAHRLIFCGSVLPYDFDFEEIRGRFEPPLLNECGTRDFLPLMAKSASWGYGEVGSFGFNHPLVEDRGHEGVDHSAFLNGKFCERFWIPFLRDGEIVKRTAHPRKAPRWASLLTVLPLKYVVPVLIVLFAGAWFLRAPLNPYEIPLDTAGRGNAGFQIQNIVRQLNGSCYALTPLEWLRGRRCIRAVSVRSDDVFRLVVCRAFPRIERRDPLNALLEIEAAYPECLQVGEADTRQPYVALKREGVTRWSHPSGRILQLCGC